MVVTQRHLFTTNGRVAIFQDASDDLLRDKRIHFVAKLAVDVDGARRSYRLDNDRKKALDDIHASAGYPHSSWGNVLVRDVNDPSVPYVDEEGYCVSMTSYQRDEYARYDRRRYLDAESVPYAVIPRRVQQICRGVLLGCKSRITKIGDPNGKHIVCVTGDFSGNSIGEASLAAARFFDPELNARNGDDRNWYLYEFFPDQTVTINGETFQLKPLGE